MFTSFLKRNLYGVITPCPLTSLIKVGSTYCTKRCRHNKLTCQNYDIVCEYGLLSNVKVVNGINYNIGD